MTHQHLPALNRYTSPSQYWALCKVRDSKSIVAVVHERHSSKTLGSLIRCMWIKSQDYTDESGTVREGWFVTPEGEHAMRLYEQKQAEEKRRSEEKAALVKKMHDLAEDFWKADDVLRYAKFKYDLAVKQYRVKEQMFDGEWRLSQEEKKAIAAAARSAHRYKSMEEHELDLVRSYIEDDRDWGQGERA